MLIGLASRAVFAASVNDSLAAVHREAVLIHEMRQQLADEIAVRVDKLSTFVAFEMNVPLGMRAAVVLIIRTFPTAA